MASFTPPLSEGGPEEFREIMLWDRYTGKFDIPMEPWYLYSEDVLKVWNRKRLTGSVVTPGTPVTLYTGKYTALSLMVSNGTSMSQTWQIFDGNVELMAPIAIAANSLFEKDLWFMPFETSVSIDASDPSVIFTFGGYYITP